MRNVGIFLFDGVETLDFAGPFEVFSVANELHNSTCFNTFTFAAVDKTIETVNGLSIVPKYHFANLPQIDLLVIPGGEGTHALIEDGDAIKHLDQLFADAELTMTVCSGAMIAAKAGWIDGKSYTTHRLTFPVIAQMLPSALGVPGLRYTGTGKIYTSAGITAGIDLALALIEKLHSKKMAQRTADYLEYRWIRLPDFFANKL